MLIAMLLRFRNARRLIEEKIGYQFKDEQLLETAFIHRSFVNEQAGEVRGHNERLEFLGDAIFGLLVSDYLYRKFPDMKEGALSELRAHLVEAEACCRYIDQLGVSEYLIVGKGEMKADRSISLDANLFEAIMGAIYLDGGVEPTKAFLFSHFEKEILSIIESPSRNWKAELQDFAQRTFQLKPVYEVIEEKGPDHAKMFRIVVKIGDKAFGSGEGHSKKEATRQAAEDAIKGIG